MTNGEFKVANIKFNVVFKLSRLKQTMAYIRIKTNSSFSHTCQNAGLISRAQYFSVINVIKQRSDQATLCHNLYYLYQRIYILVTYKNSIHVAFFQTRYLSQNCLRDFEIK